VDRAAARIERTEVVAPVALWHVYDANWVIDHQPGCSGMDLWNEAKRFGRALAARGLMYDAVGPKADLARYRLLVCPHAVILKLEHAAAFRAFAEAGGTVVFTARSGERTWTNQIVDTPRPGLLRELAGCRIAEYDMVDGDRRGLVEMAGTGRLFNAFGWSDILQSEGAEVVARYAAEFYTGEAAVTVNRVGRGRVYYVGTSAEDAFYADLVARLAGELNLALLPPLPAGVEVCERRGQGMRLLVALNHTGFEQTADVGAEGTDLLGGGPCGPSVALEPYGVRLIEAR